MYNIMGKIDINNDSKPFTIDNVRDKQLVIEMLNYEELLTKSDQGQSLYKNVLNNPLISLTIEKTLNRMTLAHFNFNTDDISVETYRTIFRTYYRSPTDYDKDVLDAVHYMRENKCVYYKNSDLNIGDKIPDCVLSNLDGTKQTSLYTILGQQQSTYTMVGAFSLS